MALNTEIWGDLLVTHHNGKDRPDRSGIQFGPMNRVLVLDHGEPSMRVKTTFLCEKYPSLRGIDTVDNAGLEKYFPELKRIFSSQATFKWARQTTSGSLNVFGMSESEMLKFIKENIDEEELNAPKDSKAKNIEVLTMNENVIRELYSELVILRLDDVVKWHREYKEFCEVVAEKKLRIQNGEHLDPIRDEAFLRKLLIMDENGVSAKGQSTLSGEKYNLKIHDREFLDAIEILIADSDKDSWEEFSNVWKKTFERSNPLLVNRALAAATTCVTTTVHESKFDSVWNWLERSAELKYKPSLGMDWYSRNIYLVNALRVIFHRELSENINGYDEYYINQFIWYMFEKIQDTAKNESKSDPDESNEMNSNRKNSCAVNRILYGPPGTGKTWSTMIHAVALADGLNPDDVKTWNREEKLRPRWNELIRSGNVRFTTFHPSMTYEDFVEGMKPSIGDTGNVIYDVEMGILRQICTQAIASQTGSSGARSFQEFLDAITELPQTLKTIRGNPFEVSYTGGKSIQCTPQAAPNSTHGVNIERVLKMISGEEVLISNISYARGIANHVRAQMEGSTAPLNSSHFVLVIDEINRGNIPAIFGELITLLEPDKRLGSTEELKVVLPGSRDVFGIPSNLHVLGTMNTADRSVEALDVALRRRFDFVEMMPNPFLLKTDVQGINLQRLLETINSRLAVLVDRDHTIGHAFFMSVDSEEDLKAIFRNKVIPLLQEFFYGDWAKIRMVLGDTFVEEIKAEIKFAVTDEDFEVPSRFSIRDDSKWNFASIYTIA